MCLGVPGKVVAVDRAAGWAVVESSSIRNQVSIAFLDTAVAPGDYLMVHAGCAIGKYSLAEAQSMAALWEEILFAD